MKKAYIIAGLLVVVIVGFAGYIKVIKPQLDSRTLTAVVPMMIDRPDIGIGFTYPSGEAGYSLIEPSVATTSDLAIKNVFLIMSTPDYIDYQGNENTEDAPPVISIMVFDNQADESEGGRITRMQNWAQANSSLTNFDNLSVESEVVEIDGAKALHYKSIGIYQKDIYLASHQGNMYLFVGQSESENDPIQQTFNDLISSVIFY